MLIDSSENITRQNIQTYSLRYDPHERKLKNEFDGPGSLDFART